MSKLITLSVTVRDDANVGNYLASLMVDMQDFSKLADVEGVSLSCHILDEEKEIKDTVLVVGPDPIQLFPTRPELMICAKCRAERVADDGPCPFCGHNIFVPSQE